MKKTVVLKFLFKNLSSTNFLIVFHLVLIGDLLMTEKIPFNEWQKIELKTAKILEVEEIPNKDKLYKLKIDCGEERTLVAGLKPYMTKEEMITMIAEQSGITKKQASTALETFMSGVTDQLKKGDKVSFSGFGTFAISKRKARTGRNPQTGAAIDIPAMNVPVFKAGKNLREAVRK